MGIKGPDAFRTISEVARELDVPQHVLRFWESRFAQVRPMKRRGGRRHYRPEDIALLRGIHRLLYVDGFTIKGVQKILRERGIPHVVAAAETGGLQEPAAADSAKIVPLQPHRAAAQNGGPAKAGSSDAPAAAPVDGPVVDIGGESEAVLHAALDELATLKGILERARE